MLLLIRGGGNDGLCPVNLFGSKIFSTLNFRDRCCCACCCCCCGCSVRAAAAVTVTAAVTVGPLSSGPATSGGDNLLPAVMATYGLSSIPSLAGCWIVAFLNIVSTTGRNRLRSTGRVASIQRSPKKSRRARTSHCIYCTQSGCIRKRSATLTGRKRRN